ncbi:unnamed protein product [Brassica oleracea var. botrytis]|uniref:Uncharacterized protein n=2 Tax=Brassica TaxID=3705 RepID=A0A3P6F172_BRAOL|nr:unnamed protein product [Brassica napus]CDY38687.1 BnaC01g28100D [Brassica napus]VDD51177.1 unnamed protein product [Brassica oleracea]
MSENVGKDERKVTEGQWTTGLYDCFSEDISTCYFTWFCPCVAFGRIAEILDKGETSQGLAGLMLVAMSKVGCGWYYASKYRAKLRNQYSLPEEPCSDGAIHFFCCSCALSQEHRELKYRGLDPSLGNQSFLSSLFSNDAISEFKRVCRRYDYYKEIELGKVSKNIYMYTPLTKPPSKTVPNQLEYHSSVFNILFWKPYTQYTYM